MKNLLLIALLGFIASCGSTKKINKNELAKVKKVAVIVYAVPEKIEFKEDPRGSKSSISLADIAKAFAKDATAGVGSYASDLALKEFIHTANKNKKLPFKLVSYKAMKRNKKFMKLGKFRPAPAPKKKESSGFGSFMSQMATMTGGGRPVASGPKYLRNFGLVKNWWDGKAFTGTSDEAEYINKAMAYLGVDAVMIINDPGYSFSCEACVGGTGSASTGSAFNVSIVGKNGKELLNLRQWFGTSPGSAPIVTGIVPRPTQRNLFQQHGIKTANVFVDEFMDAYTAK
jgi:hypothetical protein